MLLSEPVNLLMSSVGCMAPKLTITKVDVNVTSHSGDLILFARYQYHRTGTPAVFNTTNKNGPPKKTKPNLRFHLMFSTESVDITAESEETVSLHPSFTPVANTSKIPAKKVQRRSKRILERTR